MHESLEGESALEQIETPVAESREQKKLRMYEEIFRKREEQEQKKQARKTRKQENVQVKKAEASAPKKSERPNQEIKELKDFKEQPID